MRDEKQKLARKKYDQSEKGKASKKRCDEAYKASGKRAIIEQRRTKNMTEARKAAKLKYQLMRRADEKTLEEFDSFALQEAVYLRKLRETLFGFPWHVDHIVPVSQGGSSAHSNIQVVPASWNRTKSNKHSQRFFAA